MQSTASKTIYWPGINNHIKNMRDTCHSCSYNVPSHSKETLILTPLPNWPFHKICGDYFESKRHCYLTITNIFSGWICIYHFHNGSATSNNLINRALTRPYRGRLTAPSQLKLAEYFPNWLLPKFLNPIKLKNEYCCFIVHTCGYKLQFDYDHLLIAILH